MDEKTILDVASFTADDNKPVKLKPHIINLPIMSLATHNYQYVRSAKYQAGEEDKKRYTSFVFF